jgi:signal transduction histidine kinase
MGSAAAVRAWASRPGVRARAADAVYALLPATDAVSSVVTVGRGHGAWAAAGTAVVGLAATAALVLLRRRRPALVVLLTAPAVLVGGLDVPAVLAVFALAVRRRDRSLLVLTPLVWLLFAVASFREENGSWAAGTIAGAVVLALAVAGGAYVGARRDLLASLRERAEQAETTAAILQREARLAERTRIAREMHDVVAHRISLVALHAGALEVNPGDPAHVERGAALIGTTARQALDDLRGVLGVLRSDGSEGPGDDAPDLAPQPRLDDVPRLVAASVAAGVPVTFEDRRTPAAGPVGDLVGRTVYRVVQESLTNVHKHARGAAARVVLAEDGRALAVEVTNVRPVGSGELVPGAGSGLVGLRERVALAGGALDAGPLPGGGWRVAATFPDGAR